ncbi:MAG TPA: YceI family protein [Candidatus Limnocylindrales bacterium]|nr:YceI family protein [Candidatus Limnocylindrales bacterium]
MIPSKSRSNARSTTRIVVLAVIALAILGAGAGFWILFVRGTPPPPVSVATVSPGASHAAGATTPTTTTGSAGTASGTASGTTGGTISGTWRVDTSIGSFSDFTSSFVGYRVNETLAGNKANIAVGRTPDVIGFLVLDGSTIENVEISVDMTTLVSDDSRRDGQLQRQAIETEQYPDATFKLTQPIDLGSAPTDGASWDVTATGDLTLHGVTKSVSMPLHAQLSGDVVTVTGSLEIAFADYAIQQPSSFFVLSIEDHGTMELQLHFRRG